MITLERFIAGSDLVHRRDHGPTISPTEEAAITQHIRTANPSFFWSTRVLPPPRRDALQALYFFCWELRGIADGNASRPLKLALLTDWWTEIGSLYAGRPQHFVTRALSDAVERFDLRCLDFLTIIEGMEMEAGTDIRAPSLEQLYLYCKQRSVAVVDIALRILDAVPADADRVAAALGRGMVLTGILRDLTQDARRHRLYLPRELLHARGIFATTPSYVLAQLALPHVCNALAEWAADWFADAADALEGRSRMADGSGDSNSLRLSQSAPGIGRPRLEKSRRAGSPFGLVPTDRCSPSDTVSSLATLQTAVLSPPRCHPIRHFRLRHSQPASI